MPIPLNKHRLIKLRKNSFKSQSGRCYYCHTPMWAKNSELFSETYQVPQDKLALFQCTAEHLIARQDGGKHTRNNIVAACRFCNAQRHRLHPAPPPEIYKSYVHQKIIKQAWPTAEYLHI